jgi:hypothetical protein
VDKKFEIFLKHMVDENDRDHYSIIASDKNDMEFCCPIMQDEFSDGIRFYSDDRKLPRIAVLNCYYDEHEEGNEVKFCPFCAAPVKFKITRKTKRIKYIEEIPVMKKIQKFKEVDIDEIESTTTHEPNVKTS